MVEYQGLFWPWFLLEVASAGTFLFLGLKFIYFIFFSEDKITRLPVARPSMLVAMAGLSAICIFVGCFPKLLYEYLPYNNYVLAKVTHTFSAIYIDSPVKIDNQTANVIVNDGCVCRLFAVVTSYQYNFN